jgi:hypothetical protein
MRHMLEHPEIAWIERTGYPSWMQPKRDLDEDDDCDDDRDDDDLEGYYNE